jgi:Tfp pilus assembly protein PilF
MANEIAVSADALNRQGVELFLKNDLEGARLHYLAALKVDPEFPQALANLAVVLSHHQKYDAAEVLYKKVLALAPGSPNLLTDLGNSLMCAGKYRESRELFDRATQIAPENAVNWYNLALWALRNGQNSESLSYFNRARALGIKGHQIEHDMAHSLMALGDDLPRAFSLYESRWATLLKLAPWGFGIPEWKGENLKGKKILFHAEQGYGDTIMAARFAKNLAAEGAEVSLCLPSDLCRLFTVQEWEGVSVLDMSDLNSLLALEFDFHSPMYSAMRWLGIQRKDIESQPYLVPPRLVGPEVSTKLFNVGICWASGTRGNPSDLRRRVTPLSLWLQLAEVSGVQLYSLHKGTEADEIQILGADSLVVDETIYLNSWIETAAFVNKLDLVISVDTAVVHLAGALGKPTWMLSQFSHCWRWWEIYEGSGKPWYETVSIIRQEKLNDWDSQIKLAKMNLERKISSFRSVAA